MRERTKGFLTGILTMLLILSVSVGVLAATSLDGKLTFRGIKITIDGAAATPKDAKGNAVEPFIYNGSTYLPVRAVAGLVGYDVSWVDSTSTVVLTTPASLRKVYITRTGSKYHYDSSCNGGEYFEISSDQLAKLKLEPCDKCVH